MNDPLPPRQEMDAVEALPESAGAERMLEAIGASLERRGWLVWLGVSLIGAVGGIVYALQHALLGKTFGP